MSKQVLSYAEKDTPIHKLSGVTKLVFFLIWCLTSALTYDTRVLLIMIAVSFILFFISKTEWKQVGSIFKFILLMMVINVVAISCPHIRDARSMERGRYLPPDSEAMRLRRKSSSTSSMWLLSISQ